MGQKITQNVHFEEKIGNRKFNVRAKAVIRWRDQSKSWSSMEEREDCSQGNTHQARLLTCKKERPEELPPPEK